MKTTLFSVLTCLAAGSSAALAGCNDTPAPEAPSPDAPDALAAPALAADASHDVFGNHWVATWGEGPMPPDSAFELPRTFENQTVRHVVHVSAGGKRVRIRVSNAFGQKPLVVGDAHVALHGEGPAIVPGTDRPLTFGGKGSVTVAVGADAVSDPVDLKVASRSDLAVSLYVPENTGIASYHEGSNRTSYVSAAGDFAGAADFPVAETTTSRYWLSAVEVRSPWPLPTVVAFGDSITVGFRSTLDANRSWPDLLSARFNPTFGPPRLAVVNQGVGCNRLIFDLCGQNGTDRFERDVLDVAGASHVIIALGLNDIGFPVIVGLPDEIVSADQITAALRDLADRARARGIEPIGATLTPVGSSTTPGFFTPENEAKRTAVNQWIRTGGAFDGFVDFDAVVRDPADPTRLRPDFNSGDGVHPNDAGYAAMADAIDACHLW
jgi:lysophospholipase L1-like esterase